MKPGTNESFFGTIAKNLSKTRTQSSDTWRGIPNNSHFTWGYSSPTVFNIFHKLLQPHWLKNIVLVQHSDAPLYSAHADQAKELDWTFDQAVNIPNSWGGTEWPLE